MKGGCYMIFRIKGTDQVVIADEIDEVKEMVIAKGKQYFMENLEPLPQEEYSKYFKETEIKL